MLGPPTVPDRANEGTVGVSFDPGGGAVDQLTSVKLTWDMNVPGRVEVRDGRGSRLMECQLELLQLGERAAKRQLREHRLRT